MIYTKSTNKIIDEKGGQKFFKKEKTYLMIGIAIAAPIPVATAFPFQAVPI